MKTTKLKIRNFFTFTLMLALAIGVLSGCKKENKPDLFITPYDFLSNEKYESLEIEVLHTAEYQPNQDALDQMTVFLEERLNKPQGINVVKHQIDLPENVTYSLEDIQQIEEEYRTSFRKGTKLSAFIFYADAEYAGNSSNSSTLGIAYGTSSMVLFAPTIHENSGGFGQVSRSHLEAAVLIHECGHTLGLVNNGTPMTQDHEDPSRPHHCDNDQCIMYYASETSEMLPLLSGDPEIKLDVQCINDLKANGGK